MPVDDAHLLLACDVDDVATTLVGYFERTGATVTRVTSAADAVDAAAGVDVIVTDFREGGSGMGVQLLDQVRGSGDPAVADPRVIITTDLDENRLFSWQSGADDFLIRPFHIDELRSAIDAALQREGDERTAFREERMAADAHPRASGDA